MDEYKKNDNGKGDENSCCKKENTDCCCVGKRNGDSYRMYFTAWYRWVYVTTRENINRECRSFGNGCGEPSYVSYRDDTRAFVSNLYNRPSGFKC